MYGFILGQTPKETPMRTFATALSALIVGTTALLVVPVITPAQAKSSRHVHHMHMKKHAWSATRPDRGAWYGYPPQPMVRSYAGSGDVCPGIGRSFECKIWPPPFEDDPDRKTTKF
jgi:hypothetical protein